MDRYINSLEEVRQILPAAKSNSFEQAVEDVSRRSGIIAWKLLDALHEDLLSGIPFRYTTIGRSFLRQ